jgi:hypothetical protein
MSASRLGDSGDSALTRAVTQPAGVACRFAEIRLGAEDGLAARCSCALQTSESTR